MGFFKTKRQEFGDYPEAGSKNGSIIREKSRDTQLISQKTSQVNMGKIKEEYSRNKRNQRFNHNDKKARLSSKLSLKSKQSQNKI